MTEELRPNSTDSDDKVIDRFRRWFWRPPRRHGEVLEDRTVTFLELFYDLVYVVVIAQAAHHLAEHVSLQGAVEFVIIFGLVWIAWLNGSLYHELHGQRDGRTRSFVFVQMAILALLAIFTADAAGETGMEFALVYAAFLLVMAALWYGVQRIDEARYRRVTGFYLTMMAITTSAMVVSAFLPDDLRTLVWACVVGLWVLWMLALSTLSKLSENWEAGVTATDSMVERFGLFTIIVLGEVVVGVVEGTAEAGHEVGHDLISYATGLLALTIGFGLWWLYFDLVGRRLPRDHGPSLGRWFLAHALIGLSIAAAGASLVGLIVQAHDGATSPGTAWLLTGSVAVCLGAIALAITTLALLEELADVYRPTVAALLLGALATLGVGWLQPAPWLLALTLSLIMMAIWLFAINRWLASGRALRGEMPS